MCEQTLKPVPLPALDRAEWFDIEVPADLERAQWERNAQGMLITAPWRPIATGCGKAGRVHPRSYAARFARIERDFERGIREYEARRYNSAPAPLSTYGADHSELRKGKAHPRSYGADLPLRGFTDAQLVRATKDDREYWNAHPLTYSRPAQQPAPVAHVGAAIADAFGMRGLPNVIVHEYSEAAD